MSTGMSIGGSVPRYKVPAENDFYFGNYARPYKDSVTLNKYSKSLFCAKT